MPTLIPSGLYLYSEECVWCTISRTLNKEAHDSQGLVHDLNLLCEGVYLMLAEHSSHIDYFTFSAPKYCKTLKFREHLIFAQIRESVRFAKIKCSRKCMLKGGGGSDIFKWP